VRALLLGLRKFLDVRRRVFQRYERLAFRHRDRIVKLALPAALCSHGTLSLWSSTTAFELQVNGRQRGGRLGAIFISCRQVMKSLLDEGIGRFLCQIPHRSGALLLKFLVQHD
jgi:hypothetical protein